LCGERGLGGTLGAGAAGAKVVDDTREAWRDQTNALEQNRLLFDYDAKRRLSRV
jgi:hypothetical protein